MNDSQHKLIYHTPIYIKKNGGIFLLDCKFLNRIVYYNE